MNLRKKIILLFFLAFKLFNFFIMPIVLFPHIGALTYAFIWYYVGLYHALIIYAFLFSFDIMAIYASNINNITDIFPNITNALKVFFPDVPPPNILSQSFHVEFAWIFAYAILQQWAFICMFRYLIGKYIPRRF